MSGRRARLLLALAVLAAATARDVRAGAPVDGREIFHGKGNCAVCHGQNAAGTRMAPDLTDGEWLHGDGSLKAIEKIVREGVDEPLEASAPMPPLGGAPLTDDEVSAVVGYVFSLTH